MFKIQKYPNKDIKLSSIPYFTAPLICFVIIALFYALINEWAEISALKISIAIIAIIGFSYGAYQLIQILIIETAQMEKKLKIRRYTLLGLQIKTFKFAEIEDIKLRSNNSAETTLYRLVIITKTEEYPLSKAYTSEKEQLKNIEKELKTIIFP